mmetsp:Transcript_7313/g.32261  ORF Transcript_7313/g.32261 Transcript_7313/m.32261 type:complete len:208 (+) Transcript_7313:1165-1788(+)
MPSVVAIARFVFPVVAVLATQPDAAGTARTPRDGFEARLARSAHAGRAHVGGRLDRRRRARRGVDARGFRRAPTRRRRRRGGGKNARASRGVGAAGEVAVRRPVRGVRDGHVRQRFGGGEERGGEGARGRRARAQDAHRPSAAGEVQVAEKGSGEQGQETEEGLVTFEREGRGEKNPRRGPGTRGHERPDATKPSGDPGSKGRTFEK